MPTQETPYDCPNDPDHGKLKLHQNLQDEPDEYFCPFCPNGENKWTLEELIEELSE